MRAFFTWFLPRRRGPLRIIEMPLPAAALKELRDSDRFVVSYPRSGNRWLRVMLHDLLLLSRPELRARAEGMVLLPDLHQVWPSILDPTEFGLPSRILKSHNLTALTGRPMVYLFRQAADALVSHFHFLQGKGEVPRGLDLRAFCLAMLPEWCVHLELALREQARAPEKNCFLSYESMHRQPREVLAAAAQFLGVHASAAQIAQAVEANVFAKDQARMHAQAAHPQSPVLRQGKVGGAFKELPPEVLARITEKSADLYARACAASAVPLEGA